MQICFQFTAKHKFLLALAVALAILSPLKESFAEGSCTGPIYNGKFNQDEVVKKALEVIRDNSVDGRLLYDYIRKDPIPFEFKKLAGTTACIYTPKKIYINEINLSMCRHIV